MVLIVRVISGPTPSARYMIVLGAIVLISAIAIWRALNTGLLRVSLLHDGVERRTLFGLRRIEARHVYLLRRAPRRQGQPPGFAQIEIVASDRRLIFAMDQDESLPYWKWLCDRCAYAFAFDDVEREAIPPRSHGRPDGSPSARMILRRFGIRYAAELVFYAAMMIGLILAGISGPATNASRAGAFEAFVAIIIMVLWFRSSPPVRQLVNMARMRRRLDECRED